MPLHKNQRKILKKATAASVKEAAKFLIKGGLVAFPTETVYGLGANALDDQAVRKIFVAKGRPNDNPLIVHIAEMRTLKMVAGDVPEIARILMKKFWPGPLTFVLSKKNIVPDSVTAGGPTVAVRMPNHKIALALIKAAKCPVAAPSANLAGKPSPTMATHVFEDLGDNVDMVLDGGKTRHGLESTVIDVTGKKVEILRSGAVTAEMLENVLGYKPKTLSHSGIARSPGLKYRHYAPKVELQLVVSKQGDAMVDLIQKKIATLQKKGMKVGILTSSEHQKFYRSADKVIVCGSQKNLSSVAKKLFAALRSVEPKDVDIILSENFGTTGIGHAIMDRLERAANGII